MDDNGLMEESQPIRIDCPIPHYGGDDYYVVIPARWLGSDYLAHEQAQKKLRGTSLPALFQNFAISLAIAHDWRLPGLDGKPDNWQFNNHDLELIAWVVESVLMSYRNSLAVKKNYSLTTGKHSIAKKMEIMAGM